MGGLHDAGRARHQYEHSLKDGLRDPNWLVNSTDVRQSLSAAFGRVAACLCDRRVGVCVSFCAWGFS